MRAAPRPDPRRDEQHVVADREAQRRGFFGRANKPVDAEIVRLLRAARDQRVDVGRVAGLREIDVIVGGEHRDGENLQVRAGARRDRGLHGLRIRVHREKRHAGPGDALDALARPCSRCHAASCRGRPACRARISSSTNASPPAKASW